MNLLKLVDQEDLSDAVGRAERLLFEPTYKLQRDLLFDLLQSTRPHQEKIALPTTNSTVFIDIQDIVSCEAYGNYTPDNYIGLILCKVPPSAYFLPDGSSIGSKFSGTKRSVTNNTLRAKDGHRVKDCGINSTVTGGVWVDTKVDGCN